MTKASTTSASRLRATISPPHHLAELQETVRRARQEFEADRYPWEIPKQWRDSIPGYPVLREAGIRDRLVKALFYGPHRAAFKRHWKETKRPISTKTTAKRHSKKFPLADNEDWIALYAILNGFDQQQTANPEPDWRAMRETQTLLRCWRTLHKVESGSRRLTSILHEDVQELVRLKQRTVLTKEKRSGYSPKTLRLLRAAVSTVFALAIKKRAYFGPNPAVGVNLPASKRVFPKQALTVEQARQFIAGLQGVARVVVMLAIMTSMNRSEWLALIWSRINLEDTDTVADGELLPAHSLAVRSGVYRGKFDTTKTANRERIIPIPAVVVEALRELKGNSEWTDPEDLVFVNPNKRGEPLNARHLERTAIKPVAKELGFGWFSWHSARRTFSSLSAGLSSWSLTDRIAQMGHSGGGAQTEAYAVSPLSRRRIGVEDIANRLIPTDGDGPGAQAAGPGALHNEQPGAVAKKPAKKALVLAVQHQKDAVWGMS